MTQVCQRCYKVVSRACQSETEWSECMYLNMRKPYVRQKGTRWWIEDIGEGGAFSGPWDTEEEANAAKEKYFGNTTGEKPKRPGDPV